MGVLALSAVPPCADSYHTVRCGAVVGGSRDALPGRKQCATQILLTLSLTPQRLGAARSGALLSPPAYMHAGMHKAEPELLCRGAS